MVGPTKLSAPRPAVATTPTLAARTAAPASKPAVKSASAFDGSKKVKHGNLTGAFKPVAKPKAGSVALLSEVKAQQAAAAVNGVPAKADAKVADAFQRLMVKEPTTAKDLIAENAKLNPTQQHALKLALPDKLRLKLEGEIAKLPPEQRGAQITWMGDKNLAGIGKGGYLSVTVAPTLNLAEGRSTTKIKYPAKVDLGNGKSVTTTAHGGDLTVKYGKESLRAEKVPGGWAFFEGPMKSLEDGDKVDHAGKVWRRVEVASKDQWTMIQAFREGVTMAENFGARLDPGTEQIFRDRAIDAAIPGARANLDKLSAEASTWTGFVKGSVEWLNTNQKWLAPALKAGHIEMTQQPDGSVALDLRRAPGMKDSEWKKIELEFGPKVAQFAFRLTKDQQWLATELSVRDRAASGALETFNGPSFQKYLSTLPPRERLDEVTRLAQSLKGSSAGNALADRLFGPNAFGVGAHGKLAPASDLAKTIFAGARDTPEAQEALQQLTLSLGPQMSGSGADTLARSIEVVRGSQLTLRQREGVEALHDVRNPKDFEKLTKPDPKSPQSVLDQAGDVSDLLAELGGASHATKLGGSTNVLVKSVSDALEGSRGVALTRGSAFVATFQVFNSTKDLVNNLTVDNAAAFAEDATRAVGAWGAVMEAAGKTGYLSKVGKVAGPVSDAIGLINDMRRDSSSAEGSYRNNVHVGASALILAGGLAGGPVGVAGVLVGLGVKLMLDRTSESYEEMHGNLERLPNIR